MSSLDEDSKGGLVGQAVEIDADREIEIDADREIVVVASGKEANSRRNPFAALPTLLGLFFLVLNIAVFFRAPTAFTVKNINGTISLLSLLVSVVICVVLIMYGLAARRDVADVPGEGRIRNRPSVFVLLAFGLIAPLFTLWGLHVDKADTDAWQRTNNKPCIEIYEKAANIAKDNPGFRMPAGDRDGDRCAVNAVLGR
jgi:cytochrome bd-type quinol oxidase subunit 2